MRRAIAAAPTAALLLALAGCASSDHVLFVTKTSVGIDFDSKPGTASLGYERIEGYVAPRYDNGEIAPVVASVKSDGGIFDPRIRQIYATGDAAVVVAGGEDPTDKRPLKGERKLMFFGTTATTGMKIGFTTGLPASVVFGFKRKEFSYTAPPCRWRRTARCSGRCLRARRPRHGCHTFAEIAAVYQAATTTDDQRRAIVAFARGRSVARDDSMGVENFLQKLRRFSAADGVAAADRLQRLRALRARVKELVPS